MSNFVISGRPDCPNFVHAIFVAQYLSEKLPNFAFKKIEKMSKDWAVFLDEINRENNWFLLKSPVIWREINMWGGKKYLVGGLSEFWEHVYCYYGLESLLPKETLEELAIENLKFFTHTSAEVTTKKDILVITILGASSPETGLIIQDTVQIRQVLQKPRGLHFHLYDYLMSTNDRTLKKVIQHLNCFNESKVYGDKKLVFLCDTEEAAIRDADIIIHVEDLAQRDKETNSMWLGRCNYRMKILADVLFSVAKRSVRIIFANNGPRCFLANSLWCVAGDKFPQIVALTADKALPYIKCMSDKTGILVDQIFAPTVWGFVGNNSFVDIKNTVFRAEIYQPYKSRLTAPKGSTLPLGVINHELRLISYLLTNEMDIQFEVEESAKLLEETIQRPPIFSKVRALVTLLKLWYSQEIGDEIISLGVPSNGSFGLRRGVIFSQPVKLDTLRNWVPYRNFPLMNDETRQHIDMCYSTAKIFLKNHDLLEESERSSMLEYGDAFSRYLQQLGMYRSEGEGDEMILPPFMEE